MPTREDLPLQDAEVVALVSGAQAEQFSTPPAPRRPESGNWRVFSVIVAAAAGLALVATGKIPYRNLLQKASKELPAASASGAGQSAARVERESLKHSATSAASDSVRLETTTVFADRVAEPVRDARIVSSSEPEPARPVGTLMTPADEIAVASVPRERLEAVAPLAERTVPPAMLPPAVPPKAEEPVAQRAVPSPERAAHTPESAAVPVVAPDADAIRLALGRYRRAYEDLDVQAAVRVWPSVDRRALSRAFGSIRSQGLNLEHCDIDVASDRATVVCRGVLQIVPRVGHPDPVTSQQEWLFLMHKADNEWKIGNVTATPRTRRAPVTGTD